MRTAQRVQRSQWRALFSRKHLHFNSFDCLLSVNDNNENATTMTVHFFIRLIFVGVWCYSQHEKIHKHNFNCSLLRRRDQKRQRTKNRKKISHEFPSVYIRLLCESIICLLASMKIKSTSENKNANKIHTFPDFLELASAFVQISQSIQLERPLVSPASFLRSIHCCCPFPSKFVRRWICIFIFEYEFCFYFPKLNSMQRNGEREIEKKC